jgi:CRISPR-associated endonuclease Csn1
MYDNKYIIGLDIGISSVGWGLLQLDEENNPYRIIDAGSRIFTPGEVEKTGDSRAKERREKRSARRIIRRKEFRIDRVRNLLYEKHLLTGNIISEKNEELTKIYNKMINNYYKGKNTNPYQLKVEALDRKLSNEELCIILVHYAKKRGYKSNREDTSDNETGKVLSAINDNINLMKEKNYRTVSEMYIKDDKFKNKIKNSPGNYKVSITNELYFEEINKVLDNQIKYNVIDEQFKKEYIEIWSSRRHYSEGPGYYYVYDKNGNRIKKRSPYGGNLIEKMTGKCNFDNNPRAPKKAFSSELFVALTKLLNLRYKTDESKGYINLTNDEIKELIEKSLSKNKLTYNDVVKTINKTNIKFKDLTLSKKSYIKVIDSLKKKLNISKDTKLDINNLSIDEKNLYNNMYEKELFSNTIIELKGYHELRQVFEKTFNKEYWNKYKNDILLLDELALLCTNYKLNEEIKNHILTSDIIPNEFADDNFISALPNFKDHLMLSTNIIMQLIPLMLDGKRYDEAMTELNYQFSNLNNPKDKRDLLIPINIDENITNQRVIRSLTQTRKVLNAIIKKYGKPYAINIETARELAKTRKERNEIEKRQKDNYEKNLKIKNHLVELGLFKSVDKINSNDLLKYKLW